MSTFERRMFLKAALASGVGAGALGALPASAAPGKMIDTKGMKVGVVLETLSHPLIKYWGDECARQGQGFGMSVSVQDGERNVQKQTSQVEAFISQGVNFIVLQATDAAGLSPVVKKAEQNGIPVITLNQDVAVAAYRLCRYGSLLDGRGCRRRHGEAARRQGQYRRPRRCAGHRRQYSAPGWVQRRS